MVQNWFFTCRVKVDFLNLTFLEIAKLENDVRNIGLGFIDLQLTVMLNHYVTVIVFLNMTFLFLWWAELEDLHVERIVQNPVGTYTLHCLFVNLLLS